MNAVHLFELSLPFTNPILKFLLILLIILFAPILLNKIKIPHLLGLIVAGAVIGPFGFNLIERDSSIILSGTAGLLYIMFLAGLEIDLVDFKKNSGKSIVFGLYTFLIPMVLGTLTGLYVLNFSILTSVLLASMFASHTLIAYPLISRLGVAKNRAVNITVGGTMITDTLALLVLAVIVGMTKGEVTMLFWVQLAVSIVLFGLTVILVFPIIARWFFKRYDDNISQYIFVLVMLFLGAFLAELAGIEGIIGAFLCGLSLNRSIPHTSPLMNRVEFVGNAIFIPFFLIGVGMLIDYRVFFKDLETIKVAAVMIMIATTAKYGAAWLTQKTFGFTPDERRLIFGLSNAQAAATLAAVLIGYNMITGTTADGQPIRLLNESVLNGTILMILFTCTMASFVAQKGAKNIALTETMDANDEVTEQREKILISGSNLESIDALVELGINIASKKNVGGLHALSVITDHSNESDSEKSAHKVLEKATVTAAATDHILHALMRYDLNIINGISNVIKEYKISDLILGLHIKKSITDSFLGNLTEGILSKCNTTTFIYKPSQAFGTITRHLIIVPDKATYEMGFPFWIVKLWNMARNSRTPLVFYAPEETLELLREIHAKHPIPCEFVKLNSWDEIITVKNALQKDDNLIIVMSRTDRPSYQHAMTRIPSYLNTYFKDYSFMLIYPVQMGVTDASQINLKNPTMTESIEKLEEIRKTITKIFRKK
ncbi:MAG: cation:proton antiporter domain-containing protein [Aquaticitalea sp.]